MTQHHPPMRAALRGMSATCRPPNRMAFGQLRALLEQQNSHFNGAAEMLCRIEAALKLSCGEELPLPSQIDQNDNCTLGICWDGKLSLLINSTTILWRFNNAGEPRHVNDAATAGVPAEILHALAHLARLSRAN